ncbi:Beta-1,3-N-Acetylglucosaminyltransferase family protein [Carex littledalei]|uniref:Beta-1,3-N-Acetylglucosaminyltransferase family protein n=1 Tax=Carex littledalei TaxID=544730 RepID=A0A833QQK7_9POAL|nr:Beta-1,3-N-Acetylglucosaminyltransferase family protein [Carex littledalei]
MADIFKFLAVLAVFACFIYPGHAQCTLSNISVTQKPTGNLFGGKPEYEVTIKNLCPCQQSNVQFNINGFQTAEPVDPSILDKDGFVNDKLPLPYDGVTFKYASGTLFPFKPMSSQVSCS